MYSRYSIIIYVDTIHSMHIYIYIYIYKASGEGHREEMRGLRRGTSGVGTNGVPAVVHCF